jgi:very-short-patch-repair endonuclease
MRLPYRRRPHGIPATNPIFTLVDLSASLPTGQVEAAVNEADHLDLVSQEDLRGALDAVPRRPGARRLRVLLDDVSCMLTTTELERLFLPLVYQARLPPPWSQEQVGPNRVDFLWPELGLVVETDSLRYHRTTFKQSADRRRDNTSALRGLVTLRFTHGQVSSEPAYVRAELKAAAALLGN